MFYLEAEDVSVELFSLVLVIDENVGYIDFHLLLAIIRNWQDDSRHSSVVPHTVSWAYCGHSLHRSANSAGWMAAKRDPFGAAAPMSAFSFGKTLTSSPPEIGIHSVLQSNSVLQSFKQL